MPSFCFLLYLSSVILFCDFLYTYNCFSHLIFVFFLFLFFKHTLIKHGKIAVACAGFAWMKLIFLCIMKLAINLFDFKLKQIEIHVRTYVCINFIWMHVYVILHFRYSILRFIIFIFMFDFVCYINCIYPLSPSLHFHYKIQLNVQYKYKYNII